MIQNKQAEIKEALKAGKYTILGVSDMMAMTMMAEVEITEVQDKEGYAQYRNVSLVVFKARGKRKLVGQYAKDSNVYLKGWDLGLVTDVSDKTTRESVPGMSCRMMSGNALINLRGNPEEIRMKVDGAYVYGNKGLMVYEPLGGGVDEKPLYLEQAQAQRNKHAVLDRIMEKVMVA